MAKKVAVIVGARPQFIKISLLVPELKKHFKVVLIHTGQHYDYEMSDIFLKEFNLKPDYNLHCRKMGNMIMKIGATLQKEQPDAVIVLGDTNSTLAGAIATYELGIKLAHIEAGLRSFTQMPEEINRVTTDMMSDYRFCPTKTSMANLKNERLKGYLVGDLQTDVQLKQKVKQDYGDYVLVTVHRQINCNQEFIDKLVKSLKYEDVIFPAHPRIKPFLTNLPENFKVIKPVGYLEMLSLEKNAMLIMTDSGGVQREAYNFGTPVFLLRTETEWPELIDGKKGLLGKGDSYIKIVNKLKEL